MVSLQKIVLPVRKPFDWESLLAFLRARATPGVETVTGSSYVRTIDGGLLQPVSVTYHPASSSLQVACATRCEPNVIASRVRQIFKPDARTGQVEAFLAQDRRLTALVAQQPGLRVPGGWCAFEIAARAILGQQVSVPAATTLMGRLVRLAGTRLHQDAWLFPMPVQVLNSDLSQMGVPAQRLQTLKSLAAFFAERDEHCIAQPDTEERLLAIKGVGKWTAGYILMRAGNSHDRWPEGDLVLRKALSNTRQLIAPARLDQIFKTWSPYRSYATIHLWRGYGNRIAKNGKL